MAALPAVRDRYYYSQSIFAAVISETGNIDDLDALLRRLADDNVLNSKDVLDVRNEWGDTPLLLATRRNKSGAVTLLLHSGADVNAANPQDAYTALMIACLFDRREIVRTLLDKGASLLQKQQQGESALDIAVSMGNESIACMLRAERIIRFVFYASKLNACIKPFQQRFKERLYVPGGPGYAKARKDFLRNTNVHWRDPLCDVLEVTETDFSEDRKVAKELAHLQLLTTSNQGERKKKKKKKRRKDDRPTPEQIAARRQEREKMKARKAAKQKVDSSHTGEADETCEKNAKDVRVSVFRDDGKRANHPAVLVVRRAGFSAEAFARKVKGKLRFKRTPNYYCIKGNQRLSAEEFSELVAMGQLSQDSKVRCGVSA